MRLLWIIVLVVVAVLGVTSVASAAMRDEVAALVDTAVSLATDDGDDIPEEPPLPTDPGDVADDDGTADDPGDVADDPADEPDDGTVDDDEGDEKDYGDGAQNGHTWRIGEYRNHGEAVSAVAKCKDETGQNHGAAVSAVARSQAGKPDK